MCIENIFNYFWNYKNSSDSEMFSQKKILIKQNLFTQKLSETSIKRLKLEISEPKII